MKHPSRVREPVKNQEQEVRLESGNTKCGCAQRRAAGNRRFWSPRLCGCADAPALRWRIDDDNFV